MKITPAQRSKIIRKPWGMADALRSKRLRDRIEARKARIEAYKDSLKAKDAAHTAKVLATVASNAEAVLVAISTPAVKPRRIYSAGWYFADKVPAIVADNTPPGKPTLVNDEGVYGYPVYVSGGHCVQTLADVATLKASKGKARKYRGHTFTAERTPCGAWGIKVDGFAVGATDGDPRDWAHEYIDTYIKLEAEKADRAARNDPWAPQPE